MPTVAQVQFTCENTLITPDQEVCVSVIVDNFVNMAGFQYSLSWEGDELSNPTITNYNLPELSASNFNLSEDGLGVVWFTNCSETVSLMDNTPIFDICFNPIGMIGDTLKIMFTTTPTSAATAQCTEGTLLEGEPEVLPGCVIIVEPMQIANVTINSPTCIDNMDGSIFVEIENGVSPYLYSWSPTGGTDAFLENLSTGTYTLIVTDQTGFSITDSFTVVPPLPISVGSQVPDLTCTDSTGTVNLSAQNGLMPYTFSLNGENNTTGSFDDFAAGFYDFAVIDANGCSATGDFIIEELSFPDITISGDTFTCNGVINLTTQGDLGDLTWFLDGIDLNNNQSMLTATESGIYSVTLVNSDECSAESAIEIVIVSEINIDLSIEQEEYCVNDTVFLNPVGNGGGSYDWLSNNIEFDTLGNAFFTSSKGGVFDISVTADSDSLCASDTLSFDLLFMEAAGFVMPNSCIKKGETIQLQAFEGETYQWQETAYPVSNPDISSPIVSPDESTLYPVLITDTEGCQTLDTIAVEVVGNPINSIEIVNFISPNGDGENDFLVFENLGKYNISDLRVFNRYGSEVFSTINYQNDWGGTYRGQKLPSGNYFYVLSVENEKIKSILTIINE